MEIVSEAGDVEMTNCLIRKSRGCKRQADQLSDELSDRQTHGLLLCFVCQWDISYGRQASGPTPNHPSSLILETRARCLLACLLHLLLKSTKSPPF